MAVEIITEELLRTLQLNAGETKREICDRLCKGLTLEVRKTSLPHGTFFLTYKNREGKKRYHRLGPSNKVAIDEARRQAVALKTEIKAEIYPDENLPVARIVPTFRQFAEELYVPYARGRKRSAQDDVNRLNYRLLPRFGAKAMDAITRKMLVDFHLELRAEGLKGATCDHYIKLVRSMYNLAIQWDVVTINPAAKIKLFNDYNQVENYLTEDQLKKLMQVLLTHEQKQVCQVARLLLSTGARLSEALTATWDQFHCERGVWIIPAAHSKSKKDRQVPLNDYALAVLEELKPKECSGPLFINRKTGERLKTVHKAWNKIRTAAGVPFLRLHDARHLHASFLVDAGRSLYEVQQLLGHSSPQVTQRYAHLSKETLADASSQVSRKLQAATPRYLPAPRQPPPAGSEPTSAT